MDVMLKLRKRVEVGTLGVGDCFLPINDQRLFEVVDLTQSDVFTGQPVLREGLVYVVEVQIGVVLAYPKNLVVEVVEAVITEV